GDSQVDNVGILRRNGQIGIQKTSVLSSHDMLHNNNHMNLLRFLSTEFASPSHSRHRLYTAASSLIVETIIVSTHLRNWRKNLTSVYRFAVCALFGEIRSQFDTPSDGNW